MSGVKKRKGNSDIREKLIVFAVMAGITVFFCGHLSAVIKKGAGLDNWSIMLMEHLRTAPLDFFHMNYYVLYFAVCIFALIFFVAFSKRELPKAEMKGIEHGSNDFQTEEERNDFLEKNTTPIYSLDLHEFKREVLKTSEQSKEENDIEHWQVARWIKEKTDIVGRLRKRIYRNGKNREIAEKEGMEEANENEESKKEV